MKHSDVLDHPDLRKTWVALEAAAPDLEWDGLARRELKSRRSWRRPRRVLAMAAAAILIVFAGTEVFGVFAANRAIAAGSAVEPGVATFQIDSRELVDPETVTAPGEDLVTSDVSVASTMIVAYVADLSESADDTDWFAATLRLTPDGWKPLELDLDLIVDSTTMSRSEYILGFREQRSVIDGHPTSRYEYAIYVIEPGSGHPVELHVFDEGVSPTHFYNITTSSGRLVVIAGTDDELRAWESIDGATWVESDPFAIGRVNATAMTDDSVVLGGLEKGLIPWDELATQAIWNLSASGTIEKGHISGLRRLGFGYVIGGFRVSDGFEGVVGFQNGLVAYTGLLQIWEGWSEGLQLEPIEAWSSLVATSSDGLEWDAHLLPDFGVAQMVPFGDGLLAAAVRTPESDTQIIEGEDGTTYEVAASPPAFLYYSEDGLTWREIENSPALSKPLLVEAGDGTVVVVDEHDVEDREKDTAMLYIIHP